MSPRSADARFKSDGLRCCMLARWLRNMAGHARHPAGSARTAWWIAFLCVVPAAAYYARLLSLSGPSFFTPVPHGLTFNSMLLHLLQGTFDVDPETVGVESALRD